MRVERVLAPNPGPYTGEGTNTYLIEVAGEVAILDPGPLDESHEQAIVAHLGDRPVRWVIVTHTHPDHAPLANPLARALGVPACGYAPGPDFVPDRVVADGESLLLGDHPVTAVYTPGHSDDHVCLKVGQALFSGDHIIGGSSVMVQNLTAYMSSLERVQDLGVDHIYPGHGTEIDQPAAVISWYLEHRRQREQEIIDAIAAGALSVTEIVERVYADVDAELHPAAARSVTAHLRKLAAEERISLQGDDPSMMRVQAP